MKDENTATATVTVALVGAIAVIVIALLVSGLSGLRAPGDDTPDSAEAEIVPGGSLRRGAGGSGEIDPAGGGDSDTDALARALLAFLTGEANGPGVRPGEAVLRFKDRDALERFLENARASGLSILGSLDALNAVRVGYDSISDLREALAGSADDLDQIGGNVVYNIPDVPLEVDARSPTGPPAAFGANLLSQLGIEGANADFGKGVKVAVIDSGLSDHPTFANASVRRLTLGENGVTTAGAGDTVGHGTAVASLVAGSHPEASGVAPSVDLFSYAITDQSGESDAFSIATAIVDAVDRGVDLINISLGTYSGSGIIADAVAYAKSLGTLVVAAAGNEQLVDASYPARYPDVVSVGGTDANGQQLWFSNASPTLDFGAPGYRLNAATGDADVIAFTGTSASAPVVTGAIAAVMSELNIRDPYVALETLRTTSDEAGAPGADSAYGSGVLNLGRTLNSGTPGIADAAVASHYYDATGEYGYGAGALLVTVENRGTQPLANLPLTVSENGVTRSKVINRLMPNETAVFPITVDQSNPTATFTSKLYYEGQTDSNARNDSLSTTFVRPE